MISRHPILSRVTTFFCFILSLILFNRIVVLYYSQTLKFAPSKKIELINELLYESGS